MKRKVLNTIIIILTISIIFEGFICFKNIKSKNVLEDIKTVDVFNNKDKTLSIKVQSGGEGDFEWYEPTDKSKWPDYTKYTYVGTKCTDDAGTNIENTREYVNFDEVNNEATITTKKTIYCTLYFGKGRPALEVLNEQGGEYYGGGIKDNRIAVQGLYRFKGNYYQVTNNFVCIGGSLNPEKCGTESNRNYLYRIIGVTDGSESDKETSLGLEAGMLKVIKVVPVSHVQEWDTYSDWDAAQVTEDINSENFLETGIKDIIPAVYWWKGGNDGDNTNKPPTSEIKTRTTNQYKIGLMYASDYYNSWSYVSSYPGNTYSWLHLTRTRSGVESSYENYSEWTMSRYSGTAGNYVWCIDSKGRLQYKGPTGKIRIRHVFYLPSTTGLVGTGTEESPYIITSTSNA